MLHRWITTIQIGDDASNKLIKNRVLRPASLVKFTNSTQPRKQSISSSRDIMSESARPPNWPLILAQLILISSVKIPSPVGCSELGAVGNFKELESNLSRREEVSSKLFQDDDRFKRRPKSSAILPKFSSPIGNVTAVLGRDVRLMCTVEHLGPYQVAWLKEETNTIISIDTNIIITNYRIFLIPDEEGRKWVLHIKDVQESDRGFYQCQVNTNPMQSTSGYLEVVVPPSIIESQTTQVAEIVEGSNVVIKCKANGHPRPSVIWRRDDGQAIKLNGQFSAINQTTNNKLIFNDQITTISSVSSDLNTIRSEKLSFYDVDRTMAGIYVCTASNGIPSDVSRRIPLYVKFPPKTSVQNRYISVNPGDQLELECLIEAFPKPNSYWSKATHPSIRHISTRPETNKWISSHPSSAGGAISSRKMSTNSIGSSYDGESSRIDQVEQQSKKTTLHAHPHNRVQFKRQIDLDTSMKSDKYQDKFLDHTVVGHQKDNLSRVNEQHMGLDSQLKQPREVKNLVQSQDHERESINDAMSVNNPSEVGRGLVSVKQTAINPYTYKLKLTIARMQLDDYGKYTCIATNSLGTHESNVIVTRIDFINDADRRPKIIQSQLYPETLRSMNENEFQRESLHDPNMPKQQSGLRRSSGNKVVYDENYLQAIKTRQNNLMSADKMHQKLKSKVRNKATRSEHSETLLFITTPLIVYLLMG